MTEREEKIIHPTMKITPKGENDMPYEKTTATITKIYDIKTVHGDKIVAILEDSERTFNVFVNNVSIKGLIAKHGKNDENWIGKKVTTTKQTDDKYKQEMIVLIPE